MTSATNIQTRTTFQNIDFQFQPAYFYIFLYFTKSIADEVLNYASISSHTSMCLNNFKSTIPNSSFSSTLVFTDITPETYATGCTTTLHTASNFSKIYNTVHTAKTTPLQPIPQKGILLQPIPQKLLLKVYSYYKRPYQNKQAFNLDFTSDSLQST